ncbi:MAG TPA: hypothetical protein VHY19_16695 [Steroidobacteraceae bacterium]|jgi:hypothetical protein|nr:hypothetical protein [Steroidobacteraceae bacterium]
MMRLAATDAGALRRLLERYGLCVQVLSEAAQIPGSYWGESEAGLQGDALFARPDTPLHSILHESAHYICMSSQRRARLDRDAGGDDAEECAVCYLQVLMAEALPGVSRAAICADMDEWGYSFRLGCTAAWFAQDAEDAHAWLLRAGIIDASGTLTGQRRVSCCPSCETDPAAC